MLRRTDFGPPAIALGLVFLMGASLDCLLATTDRCAFPVVALEVVDGVDRSYAGRYAEDPRFSMLLKSLPSVRQRALDTAREATGLSPSDPDGYVVRFKDTHRDAHFGASSQPVRAADGDLVLVTVSARQFVLGVMDLHASLAHEFIHGLMREQMGTARYRALPPWVREGIAVWGSGQLAERARNVIAAAFLQERDPLAVLAELDDAGTGSDDYLHDALLFAYLEQTRGPGAVRKLVTLLVGQESPREAFEQVAGHGWYELLEKSRGYARGFFRALLASSGLGTFQAAQRLYAWGAREQALALLEEMVAGHAGSILEPNAWYWIGRWRSEAGRYAEAAEAFATVLRRFPRHLGLRDDSQYRLAACHTRMEEYGLALEELEEFFRVHTRAPLRLQADARYFLGLALLRMKQFDQAARTLREAIQAGTGHAEQAYADLALAHLEAGRVFNARLALSELAYRFPRSPRIAATRQAVHPDPVRGVP